MTKRKPKPVTVNTNTEAKTNLDDTSSIGNDQVSEHATGSDPDVQGDDAEAASAGVLEQSVNETPPKVAESDENNGPPDFIRVRILRDQGEFRCNQLAMVSFGEAEAGVRDGWADPAPNALAVAEDALDDATAED